MSWSGLRLSVTLLTAFPLPGWRRQPMPPSRAAAAAAMYWAPVVGLLVGALCAAVLLLASHAGHTGPMLAAVLAVGTGAAATRGLHLDGLADFADGLGSARPADQALEIMKRSDVGPFGVVTLLLALLIQITALARAQELGRGPVAIIAAAVTARLAITLACRRGVPSARQGGLGAMVAGSVRPKAAYALAVTTVAAATAAGPRIQVAVVIGLIVSLAVTGIAVRRLGGVTGDVFGAIAELAATACLLVAALS